MNRALVLTYSLESIYQDKVLQRRNVRSVDLLHVVEDKTNDKLYDGTSITPYTRQLKLSTIRYYVIYGVEMEF